MLHFRHRLPWVIVLILCATPLWVGWSAETTGASAPTKALAQEWENCLRTSDQIVLVSIDPRAHRQPSDPVTVTGYRELGRLPLKDPQVRAQVSDALIQAIAAGGTPAKCFIPRHLIEATKDGKSVSYVVCFQCGWIRVKQGNETRQVLTIGVGAQDLFNQLLKDAGISLAP